MSLETVEPTYEVGRGKPPVHSQFQPGQSGNPRGRPKGSKNAKTIVRAMLDEYVEVIENGRRRKMTKREYSLRQTYKRSVEGDTKSLAFLFKMDGDDPVENPTKLAEQPLAGQNNEELLEELMLKFGVQLTDKETDDEPR